MRIPIVVALALSMSGCASGVTDVANIVAAGGNFINSSFASTVLRCDLLLDGAVIATQTSATATSGCAALVGTATINNGSHTLEFRITSQSTSPNKYQTIGTTIQSATVSKTLGDKTQTLTTGQSISYAFEWP